MIAYHILILKTMRNNSSCSFQVKTNKIIIVSNAELGYWLAEPYWGKGIMTQMLALAISCYFHHTDVIRICANVYAGNIASMRVLEKIGFRKCGIHRNACFKNGVFTDCHYFELLKEEFRNLVK